VDDLKGITLIGINRPEKRNCVNPETADELKSAFRAFESNPKSPIAILHGKGGTFCAGLDLGYLSTAGNKSTDAVVNWFSNSQSNVEGTGPMVNWRMKSSSVF